MDLQSGSCSNTVESMLIHIFGEMDTLTKENSELWPLGRLMIAPDLLFLQKGLEGSSNRAKQSEWQSYFNSYVEASEHIGDSVTPLHKPLFLSSPKLIRKQKETKAPAASPPSGPPLSARL